MSGNTAHPVWIISYRKSATTRCPVCLLWAMAAAVTAAVVLALALAAAMAEVRNTNHELLLLWLDVAVAGVHCSHPAGSWSDRTFPGVDRRTRRCLPARGPARSSWWKTWGHGNHLLRGSESEFYSFFSRLQRETVNLLRACLIVSSLCEATITLALPLSAISSNTRSRHLVT